MKVPLISLFAFLVAAGSALADPQIEATGYHRDFQAEGEGVVIAQIEGDATVFGQAGQLEKGGASVGPDTLFEIGSITKVFTGILLADAVLKGKASLDDPVSKHLPADLLAADSPLHMVSLLDLATHTSGLPRLPANLEKGADANDPYAHYTVERLYDFLRDFKESDFEKRGELSYSNLGVGLLGNILERIGGKPYEELISETIFSPLGMSSSFIQRKPGSIPASHADRFATGHTGGRAVAHWHLDSLCGAGAIVSSARDMMAFAKAQWSPVTPESLQKAFALAATRQRHEIGLGWFIGDEGLNHDGGTGGFRSEFRLDPEMKTASLKFMNSVGTSTTGESSGDFKPIRGYWQGTLDTGSGKLRLILRISEQGAVVMHSLDQGGGGMPAAKSVFADGKLTSVFSAIGGSFEGKLEGGTLAGTWKQGKPLPLSLARLPGLPDELKNTLGKQVKGDLSGLAGYWSGYLGGKAGLFVILEIEAFDGIGEARLYSPDQTPEPIHVTAITVDETTLTLSISLIKAEYTAKIGPDEMSGTWKQGPPQPLTLKRSAERPKRDE